MSDVWEDLGAVEELSRKPLQTITIGRTPLAGSVDGVFGVAQGENADVYVEGEPMVRISAEQKLTEG